MSVQDANSGSSARPDNLSPAKAQSTPFPTIDSELKEFIGRHCDPVYAAIAKLTGLSDFSTLESLASQIILELWEHKDQLSKEERSGAFLFKSSLREVFSNFRLYELRKELKRWLYVGIANDDSAYEDVQERRNLIRFRNEIRKLAEALCVISNAHRPRGEKERLAQQPLELREKLEERNRPTFLNSDQMANPMPVVKRFCKRFNRQYVKGEMRDWLEAVITYKGKYPKPVYKDSLLIFYECLLCLLECAFTLAKKR